MSIITEKTDYVNGNAIDAEVINDVVETAINANNVATNIGSNVDISEIGNVGTPSVSITTEGHLKFSALKGETGARGEKGNKGDTGNNGLDGSSTIIKAFKNYDAGTTYKNNKDELDFVQYGGSTYAPLSTEGIVNILPTNGSYWQLIASAGASAGGNVASTNNDTLDTNVSYSFKPTNNPTTASGALNGIWQPISIPDTSVYVLKNQGTSNSSKVVMTNENGFIQDTFRSISDSVSSSTDLASCKAVYDYTYSQSDIDSKNMELGYYDTMTDNADGTYTITRQTGYLNSNDLLDSFIQVSLNSQLFETNILLSIITDIGDQSQLVNYILNDTTYYIKYNVYSSNSNNHSVTVVDNKLVIKDTFSDINTLKQYLLQHTLIIQYKLATPYTEKVEKNHYAVYNQDFILEHNKSEAERSCNLFDYDNAEWKNDVSLSTSAGNTFNRPGSKVSTFVKVEPNKKYYITNCAVICFYNSNKEYLNIYKYINYYSVNNFSFTTPSNCEYIRIDTEISITQIMLNEGDHALPYQPYEGKVVHEKDLEAKVLFKLVDKNIDEFTITEYGTYLITTKYGKKIYVSENSDVGFYGSAIITASKFAGGMHIAINGVAYQISPGDSATLMTEWLMNVYKMREE